MIVRFAVDPFWVGFLFLLLSWLLLPVLVILEGCIGLVFLLACLIDWLITSSGSEVRIVVV